MNDFKNHNSRRRFLKSSGIATLGFMGLYQFVGQPLHAFGKDALAPSTGYGPLVQDPKGLLNLPKDFSYKIISKRGDKMADGLLVPGRPDGMGTFAGPNDKTIIIRNHENSPDTLIEGAFGLQNELLPKEKATNFYDYGKGKLPGLGGTTTMVYDPKKGEIEKQFMSLAGTARNCAGGVTPWNSWLTCEETTVKAGAYDYFEKDHGYVFEVPASTKIGMATPVPIKAMGRMNHEAVAVDPNTSIVYLTEDRGDSLIYRYIPNEPGKLAKGGKLQALALKEHKSWDTRNWENSNGPAFPIEKQLDVEWLDMENVDSPDDDLRLIGFDKGAACFARGEGIWFGDGELYFACTNGGKATSGQVFRYVPSPSEGKPEEAKQPGKLELFLEPNNKEILKYCDNLTIAPWGDIIMCEDDPHPFVVGVTPGGEFYKLAENVGFQSEFAGGVFSPTGETYFINIQDAGITLAITGPWKKPKQS